MKGLYLNESVELAESYLKTKDWVETIALAQAEGLPKLVSGEIDVSEAEKALEAAE